jgi:hypothetical protein
VSKTGTENGHINFAGLTIPEGVRVSATFSVKVHGNRYFHGKFSFGRECYGCLKLFIVVQAVIANN